MQEVTKTLPGCAAKLRSELQFLVLGNPKSTFASHLVGVIVALLLGALTGITAYLKNSGTLETAQHIANHESPRTTKLYDRRQDEISLDEVERIAI